MPAFLIKIFFYFGFIVIFIWLFKLNACLNLQSFFSNIFILGYECPSKYCFFYTPQVVISLFFNYKYFIISVMVSSLNHLFRNFFLQVFIILTYGCCTYRVYLGDTLTSLHACRKVHHSIKLLKGFGAGTLATVQKGMRAREL